MFLDNLVTDLKRWFTTGVEGSPGYAFGDRLKMAVGTKTDIDRLPSTERDDNKE